MLAVGWVAYLCMLAMGWVLPPSGAACTVCNGLPWDGQLWDGQLRDGQLPPPFDACIRLGSSRLMAY